MIRQFIYAILCAGALAKGAQAAPVSTAFEIDVPDTFDTDIGTARGFLTGEDTTGSGALPGSDGFLYLSEITAFSVSFVPNGAPSGLSFGLGDLVTMSYRIDQVGAVPLEFSVFDGTTDSITVSSTIFRAERGSDSFSTGDFTMRFSAIPLPASALLLLGALGALSVHRLRT